MGDLSQLRGDRQAFKERLSEVYPDKKPGAIPVDAGTLFKFANEMKVGDIVVYPSKHNRLVNIGEVVGTYEFDPKATDESGDRYETAHRRSVRWTHALPRTHFSQSALYEIGSFITLFQISKHASEFLAALQGRPPQHQGDAPDEALTTSTRVEEDTEDFVIRNLKGGMSAERFEHFVAHLLRCMGYQARVTPKVGDGGIDIIAHRDELGFEAPIIKVQCKQTENSIGRPDVQRLIGAVEHGQHALFVTLGGYSREAADLERTKSNLRLLDGSALTELIFAHYERFEPQWQALIPLKRQYVPNPAGIEDS